jgi:hypothetical protein
MNVPNKVQLKKHENKEDRLVFAGVESPALLALNFNYFERDLSGQIKKRQFNKLYTPYLFIYTVYQKAFDNKILSNYNNLLNLT